MLVEYRAEEYGGPTLDAPIMIGRWYARLREGNSWRQPGPRPAKPLHLRVVPPVNRPSDNQTIASLFCEG